MEAQASEGHLSINGFEEQVSVVDFFCVENRCWVIALKTSLVGGISLITYFDSARTRRDVRVSNNNPCIACFGAHTSAELPPEVVEVISTTRPGHVSFLDRSVKRKFASRDLAWQAYLLRHALLSRESDQRDSNQISHVEGARRERGPNNSICTAADGNDYRIGQTCAANTLSGAADNAHLTDRDEPQNSSHPVPCLTWKLDKLLIGSDPENQIATHPTLQLPDPPEGEDVAISCELEVQLAMPTSSIPQNLTLAERSRDDASIGGCHEQTACGTPGMHGIALSENGLFSFNACESVVDHSSLSASVQSDVVTEASLFLLGVCRVVREGQYDACPAFARELLQHCGAKAMAQLCPAAPEGCYSGPINLLHDAFRETRSAGCTSILLATLDNSTLIHARRHPMIAVLSMGDCKLLVLRRSRLSAHIGRFEIAFESNPTYAKNASQATLKKSAVEFSILQNRSALQNIENNSDVHCVSACIGDLLVMGSLAAFGEITTHDIADICTSLFPEQSAPASTKLLGCIASRIGAGTDPVVVAEIVPADVSSSGPMCLAEQQHTSTTDLWSAWQQLASEHIGTYW